MQPHHQEDAPLQLVTIRVLAGVTEDATGYRQRKEGQVPNLPQMEKSRLRHGHSLPEVPQHRVPQQGLLSPAPRFREAKKAFNLPTRTQTSMGNEPQVVGAKRLHGCKNPGKPSSLASGEEQHPGDRLQCEARTYSEHPTDLKRRGFPSKRCLEPTENDGQIGNKWGPIQDQDAGQPVPSQNLAGPLGPPACSPQAAAGCVPARSAARDPEKEGQAGAAVSAQARDEAKHTGREIVGGPRGKERQDLGECS
ncbi:uncharacterized protein LOC122225955 [Panthera leo]|uniref:uncharacterized protein LOC122225955 n=1 Tax=Panthera leo TaxID=9689 RepID=UPI001C69BAEE|nr:uncharacterized protein LOC122225955 [Panthera leo]